MHHVLDLLGHVASIITNDAWSRRQVQISKSDGILFLPQLTIWKKQQFLVKATTYASKAHQYHFDLFLDL